MHGHTCTLFGPFFEFNKLRPVTLWVLWVEGGGWRQGGADASERRAASSCQ